MTWVGDNRHTWGYKDRGIQAALRDILQSARLGYCVIGSDVAGYHGRSNPDDVGPATAALLGSWSKPASGAAAATNQFGTAADNDIAPNIYIRWAEFSTFCGLFLNGGHGERRLWKRSWPELEIIRKFSWLHTELVPYMYSYVVECHNGAPPLMRPLAQGKFHYLFGNELLVAPIYADKLDWTVSLPPGRWRYLFHDEEVVSGPAQVQREFPLDEFPVFVREGAVIPLKVTPALHGIWRHQFGGLHHLAGLSGRQEPVYPVASGNTSQAREDHARGGLRPNAQARILRQARAAHPAHLCAEQTGARDVGRRRVGGG